MTVRNERYPMTVSVCGANTRKGTTCRRPAGWGTSHAGHGRCKLHGGSTPIKSGRYSRVKREEIRSLIESYEADPDPLNVLPELAAARALFQDFIERYDTWRDALLAWHLSFTDKDNAKPKEILDISDAYRLLAMVAKIAQGEKKLLLEGAISRKDLLRILTEVRRVVDAEVTDEQVKQRIINGFNAITLA